MLNLIDVYSNIISTDKYRFYFTQEQKDVFIFCVESMCKLDFNCTDATEYLIEFNGHHHIIKIRDYGNYPNDIGYMLYLSSFDNVIIIGSADDVNNLFFIQEKITFDDIKRCLNEQIH